MSVKWSPEYDSAADAWFIRSDEQRPEGSTVAHVFTGEDDARLMASAPELRAEVERLRDELAAELDSMVAIKDIHQNKRHEYFERAEKAEAEVERLRVVLNDIYENVEYWNTLRISSKIRAALQRKEGNE